MDSVRFLSYFPLPDPAKNYIAAARVAFANNPSMFHHEVLRHGHGLALRAFCMQVLMGHVQARLMKSCGHWGPVWRCGQQWSGLRIKDWTLRALVEWPYGGPVKPSVQRWVGWWCLEAGETVLSRSSGGRSDGDLSKCDCHQDLS